MDRLKNKRNKQAEPDELSKSGGIEAQEEKKEEKESFKIEKTFLGLDISTSVLGMCIIDESNNIILFDHIKLDSTKFETIWLKADEVQRRFNEIKDKYPGISKIFVEAAMMMFTPGFSSAGTIQILAKMNALVSYMARNTFGSDCIDVNVNSARKILGIKTDKKDKSLTTKEKVRIAALALYPDLPLRKHIAKTGKQKGLEVIDKSCADEIDAWILVRAGVLIHKK